MYQGNLCQRRPINPVIYCGDITSHQPHQPLQWFPVNPFCIDKFLAFYIMILLAIFNQKSTICYLQFSSLNSPLEKGGRGDVADLCESSFLVMLKIKMNSIDLF
jgi:hypothetical protein